YPFLLKVWFNMRSGALCTRSFSSFQPYAELTLFRTCSKTRSLHIKTRNNVTIVEDLGRTHTV
ncbi:hypothetical protein QMM92_14680, partial [Leptospira santarosai]|nr:hypothetical protein [Leptospira santarosai]